MIRTLVADGINQIANHPDVRPFIGGSGPLDLSGLIANPENFALTTEDGKGAYLYLKKQPGLYEVHTLSLPDKRGREFLKVRDESLAFMFLATDCLEIQTVVPDSNPGADRWAAHAGFREVFRRDHSFDAGSSLVSASYRSLAYGDWVPRDRENTEQGKRFHYAIHLLVPDDHGDDSIHDAWVGATIRGIEHANAVKALTNYNRWAGHAGYNPIAVLTLNPLVIDIRSAVLQIDADGMHVLYVREARSAAAPSEEVSCPLESQALSAA